MLSKSWCCWFCCWVFRESDNSQKKKRSEKFRCINVIVRYKFLVTSIFNFRINIGYACMQNHDMASDGPQHATTNFPMGNNFFSGIPAEWGWKREKEKERERERERDKGRKGKRCSQRSHILIRNEMKLCCLPFSWVSITNLKSLHSFQDFVCWSHGQLHSESRTQSNVILRFFLSVLFSSKSHFNQHWKAK